MSGEPSSHGQPPQALDLGVQLGHRLQGLGRRAPGSGSGSGSGQGSGSD